MCESLDPKDVEAFLKANPNFLQDRPGLLAVLNLPHGGEGAVSLVERQVSVLRERNINSRQKIAELSDIGRENDRLLEATRRTILALLSAADREALSQAWLDQLQQSFQAQMGALIWAGNTEGNSDPLAVATRLIRQGDSFSGILRPEEMALLFGTERTEGSAALALVRRGDEVIGALAVGSQDAQRYRPEDGTLFLDYLAEVIGQLPSAA